MYVQFGTERYDCSVMVLMDVCNENYLGCSILLIIFTFALWKYVIAAVVVPDFQGEHIPETLKKKCFQVSARAKLF